MAKLSPEELEQKIHSLLREQPVHRAPMSLEARVLGEIARRHARPWWQQSYAHWPNAIKLTFLVFATGIAAAVALFSMQLLGLVSGESVTQVLTPLVGAVNTLRHAGSTVVGVFTPSLSDISSTYIYAALAVLGGAYAIMLGLGATAYRVLWQHR